jgi:hypothetical protein
MAEREVTYRFIFTKPEIEALKKFLGNFNEPEKRAKGLSEAQGYLISDIYGVLPDFEEDEND